MKHRVLIMRCDEYDVAKIAGILREGMEELGVRPTGKTILKPNCVIAHPEVFPYAFTRKEFLEGAAIAAKDRAEGLKELACAERSGITVPTRFCFRNAGYPEVLKRQGVKTYYLDEMRHVPFTLTRGDRLRDVIFVPKPIVECDFLINLPKLKGHPWTRITAALKNHIGLQDDRHRLVDHNSFLEHKIADLQEVIQPRFIAVDAITAGQKMMLTPTPFPMGAVVMGTNSCAVDTVACHMIHVNPADVAHLVLSSQRGFGPMSLDEIDVDGDFPLEEVRERTRNFELCVERIDGYFSHESNLSCTVGTFPEEHSREYCWGGCPGALQESMHIFQVYYPGVQREMNKVRYVVGRVDGPLNLEKDERVIFAGDCTSFRGTIHGKEVVIEEAYLKKSEVDASKSKSNDMILKIFGSLIHCLRNRSARHIHAAGCPVSVAAHVNYLSSIGGIRNVNFDPRNLIPINVAYWQMRASRLFHRIFG